MSKSHILAVLLFCIPLALPAEEKYDHRGPSVSPGNTGPARYAAVLYDSYQPSRAMSTVRFADQFFREPGNDGYEAVIDHLLTRLRESGFGERKELELHVIETPLSAPAWTPREGRLEAILPGGRRETLHAFGADSDRDRTLLPTHLASTDVTGVVAFSLEALRAGGVLVTDQPLMRMFREAKQAGAVAVLSSRLGSYNKDPRGTDRHLDAIRYGRVPPGSDFPAAQISPRVHARLRALAEEHGKVQVRLYAKTEFHDRPLRTIVAAVRGRRHPERAVAVASHVQEPGAVDNASGIGGLLEGARTLATLIREQKLTAPSSTVVFIWGDEMAQSRIFLEHTKKEILAGISADMIGASFEKTGAIALLERDPDPGALRPLPPDEHTEWGAGFVRRKNLNANGLSLIARCALHDVARHTGGWKTREHPWEGGSDHDIFIRREIPAVLFWHFTDFAYHTSADRLSHVDPEALRRMSGAIVATALAVADPSPRDLERYLKSLALDREVRITAAQEAREEALVRRWNEWYEGAEKWLRELCAP